MSVSRGSGALGARQSEIAGEDEDDDEHDGQKAKEVLEGDGPQVVGLYAIPAKEAHVRLGSKVGWGISLCRGLVCNRVGHGGDWLDEGLWRPHNEPTKKRLGHAQTHRNLPAS